MQNHQCWHVCTIFLYLHMLSLVCSAGWRFLSTRIALEGASVCLCWCSLPPGEGLVAWDLPCSLSQWQRIPRLPGELWYTWVRGCRGAGVQGWRCGGVISIVLFINCKITTQRTHLLSFIGSHVLTGLHFLGDLLYGFSCIVGEIKVSYLLRWNRYNGKCFFVFTLLS